MPANILLSIVAGFLVGVLIASFFTILHVFYLAVFVIAPFILIVFWKRQAIRYIALFLLFLILGSMRFNAVKNNYFNNGINDRFSENSFFEASIQGIDRRSTKQILKVRPVSFDTESIRVTANTLTEYSVGERVLIKGDIEKPENFTEDFDWKGYLAKEGIGYVMNRPEIQKTGKQSKGIRYATAGSQKMLRQGLDRSLLPPHSSLYKAMVIGDKNSLSDNDRKALQKAGLSHIVAISGMHIAIIAMVLSSAFIGAGLWRYHALYASVGFLVFYILAIGAPASASRAGIMAGIAILAERSGRPNSSWRALLLAAAVMAAFNPLLLRYDIGFQLSYLAVLGILLFSEKIFEYFKKVYDKVAFKAFPGYITKDRPMALYGYKTMLSGIGGMASATISAQIFTLPLVLYHFGYASPWSIFSNILILPILGYALGSGFIAALAGSLPGSLGVILAAPAWLFSNYIWFVAELFS